MKRLSAILSAAVMTALLLCGCGEKSSAAGDPSTTPSEVKGYFDSMLDHGTVSDGDGRIGDRDPATERATAPYGRIGATEPTEGMTETYDTTEAESYI